MNLGEAISVIDEELSEREARQAKLLAKTRDAVRDCAKAIKEIHLGNEPDLSGLEEKMKVIRSIGSGFEGICFTVHQEYCEIKCFLALSKKQDLPDYDELQVPKMAWLTGLCDCVGELRRAMQIALIKGDRGKAEYYFEKMELIYDNVITLKYSGSIAQGLKPKQDAARRQVEQARSELLRK